MIIGESGTGKNLVVDVFRQLCGIEQQRFISVDVGSIQKDLIETTLFGSVKGAYTDALDREGLISLSNKGILHLDEFGELPLDCQVKFLRVIEDSVYRKVGSNKEEKVDTRFIFSTNAPLEKLVSQKKFREDLYYRICEYVIEIPPLRKRKEDIEDIAKYFLQHHNSLCSSQGERKIFTRNAIEKLKNHNWPGNIRQLKSCIRSSIITCNSSLIDEDDIKI